MTGPDPLRDELRELADTVAPADLYERSLTRSRRLGRREAAVGTTAAVAALALLGSGLWQLPQSGPPPAAPAAATTLAPSVEAPAQLAGPPSAAPEPRKPSKTARPHRPRPHSVTTSPRSTSINDLPGHIFYAAAGDDGRLVRLRPGEEPRTVLTQRYATIGVSPDGTRVAYVADGRLMVADTTGGAPQQAYAGTASAAQAPAWSPDGTHLLIGAAEPGVLDVATGTLTPLPGGLDGQQFRWSGNGATLVYATAGCGLRVAEATAQSGTPVPESGEPGGRAACLPVSVDATGDLVTVQLSPAASSSPGVPDPAPETTAAAKAAAVTAADAVLDTVTGDIVDLPVSGKVIGAVFGPDGNLLVRSVKDGRRRLSLFSPDFTLLLRAREPAALADLGLVAYTR